MNTNISYDFLAPQRIVFGWGRRRKVGVLGERWAAGRLWSAACRRMSPKGFWPRCQACCGPKVSTRSGWPRSCTSRRFRMWTRRQRSFAASGWREGDFLLAIGGGAAIDLAKAAAAMATNRESPTVKDYLEGVGRGLKIAEPPLPVLAMPSTAGTGAEATKNAVISCYDPPFKKSLRDDRLMPRIALVDPELTVTVPASVTAASGMDAITQLIESYVSRKSQPIPRALALPGLRLAIPAIAEAVADGRSRPAREAMSQAALRRAWRWPTRGWAWPTAWRPPWARSAACHMARPGAGATDGYPRQHGGV